MSKDFRPLLDGLIFILTAIVTLIIFLPFLISVCSTFFDNGQLSLVHIEESFKDSSRLFTLMRNTLTVAFISVTGALAIAVPISYILFRYKFRGRLYIIFLTLVAASIPLYVSSTSWIYTIGNDIWFNLDSWYKKAILAGLVQAFAYTPAAVLICGIAFASTNKVLEDQAIINTNRLNVFLKVNLPEASWGIVAAAAFIFLLSVQDITITDTLRLRSFAEEVYTQYQIPQFDSSQDLATQGERIEQIKHKRAISVSFPYLILNVFLCFLIYRFLGKYGRASILSNDFQIQQISSPPKIAVFLCFMVILAIIAFPAIELLTSIKSTELAVNSFKAICWPSIKITFPLALLTAFVTTVLAVIYGYIIKWKEWLVLPFLMLIAIPTPMIGLVFASFFNQHLNVVYSSYFMLVIGWLCRSLPFAIIILIPAYRLLNQSIVEELNQSGASFYQKIINLGFLLNWKAALASFTVAFILNISEIGASFILNPPGTPTLSIRFFSLIHFQYYSDSAVLCLSALFLVVCPFIIIIFSLWFFISKKFNN